MLCSAVEVSNVVRCIPTHGHARVGGLAKNCKPQLSADTGCSLAMADGIERNRERERIKNVMLSAQLYIYIYIYIYIVIHRQTVSLYHNSSVWLDTGGASSWDRIPADFAPVGYLTVDLSSSSA